MVSDFARFGNESNMETDVEVGCAVRVYRHAEDCKGSDYELNCDCDTVTITIGRKTAEDFIAARYGDDSLYCAEVTISHAIRAALEGER